MKTILALNLLGLLGAPANATASEVPDENYDFLAMADSRCIPHVGPSFTPQHSAECARMTAPRRYSGTWIVAFETSIFMPDGKPTCIEGVTLDYCPDLFLTGNALPWPGRWSCARAFKVEFIGRRSVWIGAELNYRLVADRVISVKRLPDPPHEKDECDPNSP